MLNIGKDKLKLVVCHAVDLIFSIVIFGCISDTRTWGDGGCPYGISSSSFSGKRGMCGYGIFSGVWGFIMDIAYLLLLLVPAVTAMTATISTFPLIKVGAAVLQAFFACISAIVLAAGLGETCDLADCGRSSKELDNARAAVVFAWFSAVIWVFLAFVYFKEFQGGASSTGGSGSSGAAAAPAHHKQAPAASGPPPPVNPPSYEEQHVHEGSVIDTEGVAVETAEQV